MRYSTQFTILSYDLGYNDEIRPTMLCRYLQEAASRNMYAEGPSYPELMKRGYSFLLSRLHVRQYLPLHTDDVITVQTWAYTPPRVGAAFPRYYQMYRGDELVAEAATVWALLDLKTGQLCRTDAVELHYGEDAPLEHLATRFRIPAVEWEDVGVREIRYSDVDGNNHMNNTHYANMLCDFLPDPHTVRVTALQIHYANEAPFGEQLTVRRAMTEEGGHPVAYFETVRRDGEINVRARLDLETI